MAQAYPDGAAIALIITAIIIAALLQSDTFSPTSSSGSSSRSSRSSTSSGTGSRDSGSSGRSSDDSGGSTDVEPSEPRITIEREGDETLGGSFRVKGRYRLRGGELENLKAFINGEEVRTQVQDGSFYTEEMNLIEGENTYRAVIESSGGEDSDQGSFTAEQPELTLDHDYDLNQDESKVAIKAVADSSAGVQEIFIGLKKQGRNQYIAQETQEGNEVVLKHQGLQAGKYVYEAGAVDNVGTQKTDTQKFETGPGSSSDSGGTQGPTIFNPQIYVGEGAEGSIDLTGDGLKVDMTGMEDEVEEEIEHLEKEKDILEEIIDGSQTIAGVSQKALQHVRKAESNFASARDHIERIQEIQGASSSDELDREAVASELDSEMHEVEEDIGNAEDSLQALEEAIGRLKSSTMEQSNLEDRLEDMERSLRERQEQLERDYSDLHIDLEVENS